jgi:dTDP-4-dehydrorhamnose 3,5-epimerase
MEITTCEFEDVLIIQPKIFSDDRGYFFESFREDLLKEHVKYNIQFVQSNESYSTKNVFRGFHYQTGTKQQAKLVRVVKGRVLDIIIDLRPSSKTCDKVFSIELSEENKTQLFVPRGFAHGFLVLSDDAIFQYMCDNYYSKEHEAGVTPFDKALNINWPIPIENLKINARDASWPTLEPY